MKLLNYNISTAYPKLPVSKQTIINTLNPHSYCVAKRDVAFQKALKSSDLLLPDGIGIVLAARILKGKKIQKIAGYDMFLFLMEELQKKEGSCFFLGASKNTLNLIKKKAAREFPNVKVYTYSPPFKSEFSTSDSASMCLNINEAKPDVLFVGMTAPKQEKWVYQFKDELSTNIICSIGAVFDFYAGTVKRPSEFWIKSGLEWLPRLVKQPKKLFTRNFISTPKFIWEVVTYKFLKSKQRTLN